MLYKQTLVPVSTQNYIYLNFFLTRKFCKLLSAIANIAGGKEAEGVWEHGVEENIWT